MEDERATEEAARQEAEEEKRVVNLDHEVNCESETKNEEEVAREISKVGTKDGNWQRVLRKRPTSGKKPENKQTLSSKGPNKRLNGSPLQDSNKKQREKSPEGLEGNPDC
ncbi:Hypothetical protein FKW44_007912 [Caligus rogercresseyi]|uniref:Uncharacterized protein n=1 Tax=Caligus rogercresseyi TaxID=217165 RepID=A0A7T8GMV3_CALRO|nr:Hypothetical protein FKW44_024911 [Caligus rogercresseyi]QQP33165.1 Hypothetical protein FKW44_024455 [Caligus rogercresseyi]QQP39562.1 Hypothetical protein FKW44_020494 [Caligus rogercresseyi]QQP54918.1 Hypothetical protein FKW44_007912 [Caligus rogercresseyi]